MLQVRGIRTRCWGHRGASGLAPENTLAAFSLAAELGAEGVELDVRLSRDGALVVCHDETVERLTGVAARVADLTLSELRRLDAGSRFGAQFAGERIATLDEALDLAAARGLLVNVEVKLDDPAARIEARVVEGVRARGMLDRAVLSSFAVGPLVRSKQAEPGLATALIYGRADIAAQVAALALPLLSDPTVRPDALHPRYTLATDEHVAWAHAHGFGVCVWTVNDPADMAVQRERRVEGIMSDRPDILAGVLRGV